MTWTELEGRSDRRREALDALAEAARLDRVASLRIATNSEVLDAAAVRGLVVEAIVDALGQSERVRETRRGLVGAVLGRLERRIARLDPSDAPDEPERDRRLLAALVLVLGEEARIRRDLDGGGRP